MATPQQAPLIPMPMRAPVPEPAPASIPAALAGDRTSAAVPAGAQPHFGQASTEATFTLREARHDHVEAEADEVICMPPPRDVVFATRRAVAAEASGVGATLVVPVEVDPPGAPERLLVREPSTPQRSRIAQRIASRYPGVGKA